MSEIVQNQYNSWQAENSAKFIYNGYIYVGQVDTDPEIEANQVRAYYIDENEQEVKLKQPIKTNSSGFPVISETNSTVIQVRTDSDYSVKVLNRNKAEEWYIPKASTLSPVLAINHNDTLKRNAPDAHNSESISFKYNEITRTLKDRLNDYSFSVKDFGAIGDGISDDAPAFRAAVNFAASMGGGVKIQIPKPEEEYRFKSTVLDSKGRKCFLVIPEPTAEFDDPISLVGTVPNTRIRVDESAEEAFAAICFEGFSTYKQIKNLDIWGSTNINNPRVDYVLYGADNYHANLTIEESRFYVAKESCLRLATYVTLFSKVVTAYSKIGYKIAGPDEVLDAVTSITMNSCYGLECTENAFWFGLTTNSTINAPAADQVTGFAYRVGIARGLTFNGLGAERCNAILQVNAAQGLTLNGIYTLSIGTESGQPTEALIDILGGKSTTITGVELRNPRQYDFIVKLGNIFGNETVSILDSSINPRQVTFVPNLANSNPFKFLVWDTSNRNFEWPITDTDNLITVLQRFENTQQNHVQTLKFPDGDFTLTKPVNALITRVGGRGQIVFKGGENSRIVVSGANQFTVGDTPVTLDVIFENIDLHMEPLSGISQGFVFNGRNIKFKSSNITSSNNFIQYAVADRCGIFFDSNSAAQTAFFTSGNEYSVTLAPRANAPTGPYPNRSIAYAENPDGTTNGWIRGSGGWFAFS